MTNILIFSSLCRTGERRGGKKHFRKQTVWGLSVFYQRSIRVTIIICSDSRAHNAARIVYNVAGNREKMPAFLATTKKKGRRTGKKLYSCVPKVAKAISTLIKSGLREYHCFLKCRTGSATIFKRIPAPLPLFLFYIFMYLSALLWICTPGPSCTRDNTNPVYVRYLCNITPLEI